MINNRILLIVYILFMISLIMTYSFSLYPTIYHGMSKYHFIIRQAGAIFLGLGIIFILSKLDPKKFFRPIGWLIFSISFLALIIMPFLGINEVLGAKRWIKIGSISIAPIEFFKIGFIFFLSWSFARKLNSRLKSNSLKEELRVSLPYIVLFLISAILIGIFQKDLGQVVVLGLVLMSMFILVGRSFKFFLFLGSLTLISFLALIFFAGHRVKRILSWWLSIQDKVLSIFPNDMAQKLRVEHISNVDTYQLDNSIRAIKSGGILGEGIGAGIYKLGYLSEVHTDFVLSGWSEEAGILGLAILVLLYIYLIYNLFKIAANLNRSEYYLFTLGVALLITFTFLVNSYGVVGLAPIKGIAVPFLSYGGSQIVAISIAIGMVLMVSKQESKRRNKKEIKR